MNKKNKIIISIIAIPIVIVGVSVFYTVRPASGLESFIKLTQTDPLFYSPFFDAKGFSLSVSNLKKSEQSLKKTALINLGVSKESYASSYADLIQKHQLFPTDFLELLPEISKITDDFIAHPTSYKARNLLVLYGQAQKAYDKNILSMARVLDDIDSHIPDDHPIFYFFTDSATSLHVVQNDFALIQKNNIALKQEIQKRRDCLSGKNSCPTASAPIIDKSVIAQAAPVLITNPNNAFVYDTLPLVQDQREISGPYPVASNCWTGSKIAQPMYALYSQRNGNRLILPKLAYQNYYRGVSPTATDAISKELNARGLKFYSQPEGTTYECSDLRFYPEILTLDFMLKHNAEASPEYAQLWNNQFGLLAPALESLADFTNLLESSQRASKDFVLSPQFLFITRSAYSLTYLSFAKSVWRIDEDPQYLISREDYNRMGAPKQFKTLTELQKDGVSLETIRKSHINQRELIESLVK